MPRLDIPPVGPRRPEVHRQGRPRPVSRGRLEADGTFPVTALMTRQAQDVVWLTLENGAGETTRMGVTSQHPLFAVGEGWTSAGELVAGDLIRDRALQPLRLLSVELDTVPTRVHNIEVAGAGLVAQID